MAAGLSAVAVLGALALTRVAVAGPLGFRLAQLVAQADGTGSARRGRRCAGLGGWVAASELVVVVAVAGLLRVARRDVRAERWPWLLSAAVGGVGTLAALRVSWPVCNEHEGLVRAGLGQVVATGMLGRVAAAGLRGR